MIEKTNRVDVTEDVMILLRNKRDEFTTRGVPMTVKFIVNSILKEHVPDFEYSVQKLWESEVKDE